MHHPTERTAHTTAFVTPVVEHWLDREIAKISKQGQAIIYIKEEPLQKGHMGIPEQGEYMGTLDLCT